MKLWTHSYPAHPKNGDVYLVGTSTYLVSAAGDRLTSRRTVPFSALDSVPLVLFCRPNSWRVRLDQLSSEHGTSLNAAVEADSLSLQTHIVANGGVYALLGPYDIAAASKSLRIRSSKLVDPTISRHIAPDSENKIVGVREAVAIICDGDTVACCSVCSDAS